MLIYPSFAYSVTPTQFINIATTNKYIYIYIYIYYQQ